MYSGPICVCAHPHATAWLLRHFSGPHLMLKMDMDKTIVAEGRAAVKRQWRAHTQDTCTHTQQGHGKLLNPDVMNQTQIANFSLNRSTHMFVYNS